MKVILLLLSLAAVTLAQTGWQAPQRRVIYLDWKINWSDLGSDIKNAVDWGYNVIILSFYIQGPVDACQTWQAMSSSAKSQALQYAHARNASVMVSAGGGTFDAAGLIAQGTATALWCQEAAQWAVENQLDGVDFDIELPGGDSAPFKDGSANDWLVQCTNLARDILGPDKLISHAPQGPYLGAWADYGYAKVFQSAASSGGNIDFLNVQYYNQGNAYASYSTLFFQNPAFPGSAVNELMQLGIPAHAIVVGKPVSQASASTGYVSPNSLVEWGSKFHSTYGWGGGYMVWMYSDDSTVKTYGGMISEPFETALQTMPEPQFHNVSWNVKRLLH